jgi:hypothetical protein
VLRRVMGYKKYLSLFLFFIQCVSSLWALNGQNDSLFYQIGFEQELNSYKWLSQIYYKRAVFGKGLLRVNENFNSSLIRLSRDEHKWRDDQRLNFNLFIPYSLIWGLKFAGSANSFSDRLSGVLSDIKTNWAAIGLQLQPLQKIKFNSAIGYKYDDRLARTDRGTVYDIQLTADSVNIKDYENQFYFINKGDKYSIRKNNDFEIQHRVRKYFQEDTFDSLYIFWTKKRRDNYDLINTDKVYIESLEEENRGIQHYLIYGAPTVTQFRFRTLINSRQTSVGKYDKHTIIESRSKKDFHSENEIGVLIQRAYMMFNVALVYATENQKNDVPDSLKAKRFSKYFYYISPDFQSSRLTLSTRAHFYLFKSDTLQLNGYISRYQYDTPENNVDDRDELRLNISISEIHHFSPYLKLISNGSVNLNHLVYIFGERSANNNWMRIFRLFPKIIYRPNKKFSLEHQVEVLTNYVDYDYEIGTSASDLKSYVFRKFSFTQEINAQMTNRTGIFFSSIVELEENGKLDWERWTEFLQMSRETFWLRMNLNFRAKAHIIIAPGFLFLRRIEKNQSYSAFDSGFGGKRGTMISYGPTLKFIFSPNKRINLSFEGMRRIVTSYSVQRSFFNHFYLALTWYN